MPKASEPTVAFTQQMCAAQLLARLATLVFTPMAVFTWHAAAHAHVFDSMPHMCSCWRWRRTKWIGMQRNECHTRALHTNCSVYNTYAQEAWCEAARAHHNVASPR